ncbi:hypothetical protein EV645_6909 [Kribbella rubisoli]|uniref:Uncharacterized protein n=1 Tax=Kribbella rubisoli TaxID=3075929 RepID=A0A4Q7WK41_9ACTN|nr:hypothetical protein EV645_6909 [Kribbella rubisoli]
MKIPRGAAVVVEAGKVLVVKRYLRLGRLAAFIEMGDQPG